MNKTPWGYWIRPTEDFKILVVKPGQTTSLQRYHHHDKRWLCATACRVLKGETVDTLELKDLLPGDTFCVPGNTWHCLINPSKLPAVVCEESNSDAVVERHFDMYNRAKLTFPLDLYQRMFAKL